jgi:hypothetical protein
MDQTVTRFANSATRDAAFGGAGQPVLAEGRLCYLDDVNLIQFYDGASWVDSGQFTVGDGTITNAKLAANSITSDKIAAGTVIAADIAAGSITNTEINASAVIALTKLATGTQGTVIVHNASGIPTATTISGDITISNAGVATIAANSVALGTDTTGNYVATVAGTANQVTISGSGTESAAVTVSLPQDIATTSNPTFAGATLDAIRVGITAAGEIDTSSGNLTIDSAGGTTTIDDNVTITGNLTVNGSSVTSQNTSLGYTTTATSAGTLTLTSTSTYLQYFTGATTHTVVLPVTSTLQQGTSYEFHNNSTGAITVNSSGGNLVFTIQAAQTTRITCILVTGTTAASWDADVTGGTTSTGTGALVFANSPTLITPALGVATGTSFNSITGLSSTTPVINGTAAVGTGTTAARADHVHPTDTSRAATSGTLAQFAATTSSQLAGVISDETGTGALVFASSPTLTTPVLGAATGTSLATTNIRIGVTAAGEIDTSSGNLTIDSSGGTVIVDDNITVSGTATLTSASVSGRFDGTTVREAVIESSVSASVVTADYSTGDIFYVGTAPASNFTVNLTNAPTDNGKSITVVIFVTQGATGYIPNAVQVAGSAQTIKWANGAAPTPTSSAGKIDIFSFTFVRRSSAWTVFGSSNLGY